MMDDGQDSSNDSAERFRAIEGMADEFEAVQEIKACETAVETVLALQSIDTLEEIPREESIEEARKILRWFRNMEFADREVEEWLDHGTAPVQLAKKKNIQKLIDIFSAHLKHLRKHNPELLETMAIANARDAAATLALAMAEHTRGKLPEKYVARFDALIDSLPASADQRIAHPLNRLIELLELGIARAAGKGVDMSAAERLLIMNGRVQNAAQQVRTASAIQPVREESFDLARDMLTRLKALPFNSQTVSQFVATAGGEERAAFAQQIAEMAEVYQNLLAEAAALNSTILNDVRIKNANDSMSGFAHAISLMAAREMPTNAASAMQISADGAHGDGAARRDQLISSMLQKAQDGMEKAMSDIDTQHQKEKKERAQESTGAQQESDQRPKRRSNTTPRSGKGMKQQRKAMLDITADDYALKQGRFEEKKTSSPSRPEPKAPSGLKEKDLAAIKKLGGSLRDIGNQLKGLTVTTVAAHDKITPDNKTRTQVQQQKEREQQPNNPRGPNNGPRV